MRLLRGSLTVVAGIALAGLLASTAAQARKAHILHAFTGSDGSLPSGSLIKDKTGSLYGTAYQGGTNNNGVVFKVSRDGTETTLHRFGGGEDGALPLAGLTQDASGNLYGTASSGGLHGVGVIFRLAPDGTETVLHAFTGADGAGPRGTLAGDESGNLYGTTQGGGAGSDGVVFKLAPDGTYTVLHAFSGNDGYAPLGGVIRDANGNLYGTTGGGGTSNDGVVFKLAPDGTETILHTFSGGGDGIEPWGELMADEAGDLYGTTEGGGKANNGTIFKIAPDGKETVLYSFSGGSDGGAPMAGLVRDASGNLYGATVGGGMNSGVVYRLTPTGAYKVLHTFLSGSDGAHPQGGLILDKNNNLYGTTALGGSSNAGTVFKIRN